ncbi:MAG TPA: CHAD domain-containing protein [Bryobacteraceae bacterium]|nr:CHAD domain-containing protein [Bryobacteraceae bacterium]
MKPAPIAKFALSQTRVRLKRVTATLRRAAKHPEDARVNHDLRVAIRKFSQCLRTFRGLFEPQPVKKMRKRLRQLMALCGAKRDYDVGLQVLEVAGLPPDSSAVLKFREHRDSGLRALAHYLGEKRNRSMTENWRKQLQLASDPQAEWDWSASVSENAQKTLPRLAGEFFREGDAAAAALGDYETLHRFRLRAKRFRYTLEIFGSFYGARLAAKAPALRGLQDRMGAINDCVVVLHLEGMDRAASGAVKKLLAERDAAFRKYWHQTFSLRSRDSWARLLEHPRGRA